MAIKTAALETVLDKMNEVLAARQVFGSFDENDEMDARYLKCE